MAPLLLVVALCTPLRGADFVYVDSPELLGILEGEILEVTDAAVRLRRPGGEEISIPRVQVVALERERPAPCEFVVTETDADRLEAAVLAFRVAGEQALEVADNPDTELEKRQAGYRTARIALERAQVCLDRLRDLYPDREEQLEAVQRELLEKLAHARRLSGVSQEEETPDEPGETSPPGETPEEPPRPEQEQPASGGPDDHGNG
jgi:hypothetical protein